MTGSETASEENYLNLPPHTQYTESVVKTKSQETIFYSMENSHLNHS